MKAQEKQNRVIELITFNNDLSIIKIGEFLEYLQDEDLLNENGKIVKTHLWEQFIKE